MEAKTDKFADGEALEFISVEKCPLCGGIDRIPYKFFRDLNTLFHYWLCECSMVYAAGVVKDQKAFYSSVSPATSAQRFGVRANDRAHRTLEYLQDDWNINSHLDVGCGGDILLTLVEEKYGCVGEGVDYDPQFCPSHTVYESIDRVDKTYDLITAIHVLEHEPDPLGFLQKMVQVANKYILIEVPSIGQSKDEHVKHVNVFNPWTLRRLTENAGITLLSIEWRFVTKETYSHAIIHFIGEV